MDAKMSNLCCKPFASSRNLAWLSLALVVFFQSQVVNAEDLTKRTPVDVSKLRYDVVDGIGGNAEGFVEYLNSSAPGGAYRICQAGNYFNQYTADIFCKNFGYNGGSLRLNPLPALAKAAARSSAVLTGFQCLSGATKLSECITNQLRVGAACGDSDIVYLRCFGEKGLRLVDGPNGARNQGRLQMFQNRTWQNLCSVNFKAKQINVDTACKLLGFPKNATSKFTRVDASKFDPKSKRNNESFLLLPYMACTGSERVLTDCISGTGGDKAGVSINENKTACLADSADAAVLCAYSGSSDSPPVGAIVGGVIAGVFVIALLSFAAYYFIRKGRGGNFAGNAANTATLGPQAVGPAHHTTGYPANGDMEHGPGNPALGAHFQNGSVPPNGAYAYNDSAKVENAFGGDNLGQSQPVQHPAAGVGIGNPGAAGGVQQPAAVQDAYKKYLGNLTGLPGK